MIADAGNGVICEQLAQKYSVVLGAATACTPGAPGQCQVLAGNVPTNCPGSLCGQQSYVNDSYSAELEEIRQSWLDEGCGGPPSTCITIACAPAPSVCVPTIPSAVTGTCVPLRIRRRGRAARPTAARAATSSRRTTRRR